MERDGVVLLLLPTRVSAAAGECTAQEVGAYGKMDLGSSQVHTHARPVAVQACSLHANSCSLADSPCPSALPRPERRQTRETSNDIRVTTTQQGGYQNITATSRPGPRAHGPRASPPPEMSRSKRPLAAGRSPGRRSRWCRWTRGRRGTFASSRAATTRCRQPRRAGRHDRSHSTACAYAPVVPRACGAPPDVVWPEGGGGGCVHPLSWSHCLK